MGESTPSKGGDAAGIPSYWRVETDPIQIVASQLGGREYVEKVQAGAGSLFQAVEPFAVDFDPAGLLP